MINIIFRRLLRYLSEIYYFYFPNSKLVIQYTKKLTLLNIETTNICNANCVFCAYQYQERAQKFMDINLYHNIVDQYIALGGKELSLIPVVGDPLVDPNIVDKIKYASNMKKLKKISTITNCINTSSDNIYALLTSGITDIEISTSGFEEDTYRRVYRSKQFHKMKENVINILETNQKLNQPVNINIGLRSDIKIDLSQDKYNLMNKLANRVSQTFFYDNWSGRINNADLPNGMFIRFKNINFKRKYTPCSMLYVGLGILVDGSITCCACRDLNGDSELVLGNILDTSLEDAWQSKELVELRNEWKSGKYVPKICRDCRHYNPNSYLMTDSIRDG